MRQSCRTDEKDGVCDIRTDLAYAAITKLAGAWQHWRQGTVDTTVVRYLAVGSLPASLLGVGLLFYVRQTNAALADTWLVRAIAMALILAALLMLKSAQFFLFCDL